MDNVETIATQQRDHSLHHVNPDAPIGLFDSGAGGLTILSAVRKALPLEEYIYIGDTAHCPYGVRDDEDITALTLQACRFLQAQGVKLIIVACNTASQTALPILRANLNLPIIGVVPAVKPAAQLTQVGRIGVTATNRTVQSLYLQQLIAQFASGVEVYPVGCSEFVPLVERGEFDTPETEATVRRVLQPMLQAKVDVIVLGSTHFPALRPVIQRVAGQDVRIIDSSAAIARRAHSILEDGQLLRSAHPAEQTMHIWCSGDPAAFSLVASVLLGEQVNVRQALL